ncbi:MAG: CopD family protein [Thermodesulfovibrionales bacterium]
MRLLEAAMVLAYWPFLAGTVFVAGGFAVKLIVTGPSGADFCVPGGRRRCLGESASVHLIWAAVGAFAFHLVHMALHAAWVTETPLSELGQVLPAFLTKMRFGRLALLRSVLLALAAAAAWYSLGRNRPGPSALGLALSVPVLVTLSMSGHQGVGGYMTAAFALDVLHALAVSVWIGGLFLIRRSYAFLLRTGADELQEVFTSLMTRFSGAATWAVAFVLASGAALSLVNVESVREAVETPYGITLLVKVVLALFVMLLGGVNKLVVIPMFRSAGRAGHGRLAGLKKTLYNLVTAEMYIGLAVLLLTSVLVHLSPAE